MKTLRKPLFALTATDLMSRHVLSIPLDISLQEAAKKLVEAHVHGAPVIDSEGRCVGIFSSSDLVRWAAKQVEPPSFLPRTCQYQETLRELGTETVLCTRPKGACPIQQAHERKDGVTVTACREPHSVPVDWQIVHPETLPKEDVQHYMTTGAMMTQPNEPITLLAKRMSEASVNRLVVVDNDRRPIGMVSSSDLIAALGQQHVEEEGEEIC
jgi:CBS-domain-containing membrane protein